MARLIAIALGLALLGGVVFLALTRPDRLTDDQVAQAAGDAARGETLFWAGGCASCHAAPGATGDAKRVLAGGHRLETPFGTFVAPNISPDPTHGIGAWSERDFANAMRRGVAPDGRHYYPAFPYTEYARMDASDVSDLLAYIRTLPASGAPSADNELTFPFNVRRGVGLWKRLYLDADWVAAVGDDPLVRRGRYLVEGPGHCGVCHTPRDALGGPDRARWLAGGPSPDGKGRVPGLTPAQLEWSAEEIVESLTSGFTPDYDSLGGAMADVVENTARLTQADREAIAAYLKALPASP